MGYIASAADYLGLGTSRGFHPYVHRATEASAGIDMLRATMELVEQETGETEYDHLFVSGYSQGGHGAMALVKDLEENHTAELPLTASTPMSGPYDMSGVMFDVMTSFDAYAFSGYIPYTVMGYQEMYGNIYGSVDELFKPAYVPGMEAFYNDEITLTELTVFLFANLFLEAGASIPRVMFKDSVIQTLIDNPDHPLRLALKDNDTHTFTPVSPMQLYYCTADDQVNYRNSVVADSILRMNGATDLQTFDLDPGADHGACARPALIRSAEYFDGFVQLTDTDVPGKIAYEMFAFPNPATDRVHINAAEQMVDGTITLFNLNGRIIRTWRSGEMEIGLREVPSGLYLLRLETPRSIKVQKLYIQR